MKKYGLQLRVQPTQKKQATRPPLPPPVWFRDDDDDNDDGIEREISRQALKNKSLKDIEEQHKKALEEDPSVFDYDGVYDEMKEEVVRPQVQDRQERKPKYIQKLIDKAKEREREHEIIYERKLAKERSKDEHLFADKDKFVTGAYKRKLAEQAKWLQEDRLRQLREEKEDVTKKSDISDFYFNLSKNVAFGADGAKAKKAEKEEKMTDGGSSDVIPSIKLSEETSTVKEIHQGEGETSLSSKSLESQHVKTVDTPPQDTSVTDTSLRGSAEPQPLADQPKAGHHKRNDDAVSAAKERFLARKRAKEQ